MNKDTVKYIATSDIHLGHHRTDTFFIVNNLKNFFSLYEDRDDIDIIFIAGDFFDRLLNNNSEEFTEIQLFIDWLLRFCSRKNIKLRVLEGTPSHDWRQNVHFDTLLKANDCIVDFKYFKELTIEIIEDLDVSVLYIPDEWDPSTDKTFEDVKKVLEFNNLSQVDLAMMHGQFSYQLPAHIQKIPRHLESNYLPIVRYFINIGHVHSFSVYERIIAQGSFDRLSHNEEEPKGAVECHIHKNGDMEFYFIENKNAKLFKTIDIKHKDVEKALIAINKVAIKLPIDSFLRVRAFKEHPILSRIDEVKKLYPMLHITKVTTDETENYFNEDLIKLSIETTFNPILLTCDNLKNILFDQIKTKYNFTDERYKTLELELQEVM